MLRRIAICGLLLGGLGGTALLASRERGIVATARSRVDRPGSYPDGTLLPSGWALHPAGRQIPIADMPVGMTLSPDGAYVLVSTAGFAPSQVLAIDTGNEQLQTTQTLDEVWEGMAFSRDGGQLFVSGGGRGLVWRFGYEPRGGDLIRKEPLAVTGLTGREAPYARAKAGVRPNAWIAGIAPDRDGSRLYVLNNQEGALYCVDAGTGAVHARAATGDHPNAVCVSPDGSRVYVTNQGSASVSCYESGSLKKLPEIAVGKQPVALLFSKGGERLFVANSGSNSVSVVDAPSGVIRETVSTALYPEAPAGSTPNAMALSPDGRRLYVTNADNNDVAVIDVSDPKESRVLGFIPTGWYPTAVAVSKDGRKLFVGNGKGVASKPSYPRTGGGMGLKIYNNGPHESYGPEHNQVVTFDYICSLLRGSVSVVDLPDYAGLARYTKQVLDGCPYRDSLLRQTAETPANSVIPTRVGAPSPIKHVLYIIKENRTYDQVFGDMKAGNGDPNLCLFGETVTPNHHALAREYVLLDNLYCNGEVSEDGHQWCNAAMCTDWTEKVYPGNYATPSRGDAPGSEAVSASAGGYLWDVCAAHGLSYRTYGEFTSFKSDRENAPSATSESPNLRGHISLAWEQASHPAKARDFQRADAFIGELKEAEKSGEWPNYMVMSLGEDHTTGLLAGHPTPWASVASNDLALGKIVEAVSRSRFWPSTAIFVIEDDAQAGPDHVDAHRTVGLVISPYVKRHAVDHTLYTTASFVRTMELLLGLPPMTQYDAGATPLFNSFGDRPLVTAYRSLPARTDVAAMNAPRTPGAAISSRMDFSAYDRCDPMALNRLLWQSIKGPSHPYPGAQASAGVPMKLSLRR